MYDLNALGGGAGGYSQKSWVYGTLPKTLTLFMTKICDFCYPIYDLPKNSIPYFMTVAAAGTVALNISYEGILLTVLLIMMKK